MALSEGTKLGPYQITGPLGKGGMGEVYQATDTNLNRQVAIKVIPTEFAQDTERLARFEREAKTLASLNHPNIAQIYGFEKSTGVHALVMELVEGPTLADRITQGPIPVDEALPIAKQIAEALEAAHEQGIIHRDLKPANVKVKPDGTVKVLDFGLAKAMDPVGDPASVAMSPTLSMAATQQGVILGTAAYMSPEQAAGRDTDKKTDIWALGAVLFEMLSGSAAFGGDDISNILASVLKTEPDWSGLPPNLNSRLTEVLQRSLEKSLNGRYHDVADMRLDIGRLLAEPDGAIGSVAEVVRAPQSKLPWIAAFVLGLVIAGGTVWIVRAPGTPESGSVSRFYYDLPAGLLVQSRTGRSSIAISNDGNQFLYKGIGSDSTGLYIRSMNQLEARLIPGSAAAENPVFSPDGREIAYYQGTPTGQLMKVAVSGGGAPVVLADSVANPFGMSWGRDGTILYGQRDGIWQVSENGGAPIRVVATEQDEQAYGPQLLPGGEWVLFSLARTVGATRWDDSDIVIESLSSADRRVLWQGGSDARYVPTGHLVYASGDGLFALPFDADRLEPTGGPASMLQGVLRAVAAQTGYAFYSTSEDGTLIYLLRLSDSGEISTPVTVDRRGNPQAFTDEPRNYTRPRFSPDGSRVAVEVTETVGDSPVTHTWILNVDTGSGTQLTFEGSQNQFPVWTRDSQAVVFTSDRSGSLALYTKSADGSGQAELVFEGSNALVATDVLPDGTLLLQDSGAGDGEDIWTLPLDGDGSALEFLATPNVERSARFSPDGRWIAYVSDESGQFEIYVRPYAGAGGGQRRVSEGGAGNYAPVWSADGRELYYVAGPPEVLMSVSIQTEPSLQLGRPQELFQISGTFQANVATTIAPLWDVAPDGSGFVFVEPVAQGGSIGDTNAPPSYDARIYVVQNWHQELLERVPVP